MADLIRLEVVTPEKEVFSTMVESFVFPSVMGNTGVLYNHAPLLTVLEPGVITYKKDNTEGKLAVSNGFLELKNNIAEILVSSAELPEEIDTARAEAAAERARERLHDKSKDIDHARAEAALKRALARLKAVQ